MIEFLIQKAKASRHALVSLPEQINSKFYFITVFAQRSTFGWLQYQ